MQDRNISSGELVKSTMWYTVGNFLEKGIAYLTVPLFARLMTKAEMGDYSSFLVWLEIFVIVIGFSLESSINRARIDFPGQVNQYCSTLLILGTAMSAAAYMIVLALMPQFEIWLTLKPFYIHLLFAHLLTMHAYSIFLARQRIMYKYKTSVLITVGYAVISTGASIALIFIMDDKFKARAVGHVVPYILISMPVFVYLLRSGKSFQWKYVVYALGFCWPFVLHSLALRILNVSDRIMITNIRGSEENATYTIANNCVAIATLFFVSLNTAISPWVFDQLEKKDLNALRKMTLPYVAIFALIVQVVQLAAPEVLLVVGGQKYLDAKDCFLPLFTSVFFQFCYAMYVNIEQYSRKTWAIAAGTSIAAALNVGLNLIFIPKYGYVAAAYTTLAGVIVLFGVHYAFVRSIGYKNIYNDKVVFAFLGYALAMQFVISFLYQHDIARYIVLGIFLCGISIAVLKYKNQLLQMLKKRKKPA